jgi:hypothetical protein
MGDRNHPTASPIETTGSSERISPADAILPPKKTSMGNVVNQLKGQMNTDKKVSKDKDGNFFVVERNLR